MTQKQNAAMNQAIDLLINNDTDVSTLLSQIWEKNPALAVRRFNIILYNTFTVEKIIQYTYLNL